MSNNKNAQEAKDKGNDLFNKRADRGVCFSNPIPTESSLTTRQRSVKFYTKVMPGDGNI